METSGSARRNRSPLWLLILIAIVPAAIVAGVLWFLWIGRPVQEGRQFNERVVLQMSGLSRSASNKLDPRFTDADADLVADAPSDPAALVDPQTLIFSYVPVIPEVDDETAGATRPADPYERAFADFIAHLSRATGRRAEYRSFSSINDQLKAMRDGELHVAGFNTGAVPVAVNLCGFVPVCKLATADGVASYRMQLIVPAESPIKSIADLHGAELTATDPASNSGYKAPLVVLHANGMNPERDYTLRFSNGHDESIRGIANKTYQVAAVASDVLRRAVARGDISPSQYRVIYESEAFPTACFGYIYNLKPELAESVRKALFSFEWKGTGVEREFISSDQARFVPAHFKDDWALIRRIDEQAGTEYKID